MANEDLYGLTDEQKKKVPQLEPGGFFAKAGDREISGALTGVPGDRYQGGLFAPKAPTPVVQPSVTKPSAPAMSLFQQAERDAGITPFDRMYMRGNPTSIEAKTARQRVQQAASILQAKQDRAELYKLRTAPAEIAASSREAVAGMTTASKERVANMTIDERKQYHAQKATEFDAKQTQQDAQWHERLANMDANLKQKAQIHSEDAQARVDAAKKNQDWAVANLELGYKHDERMLGLDEASKKRLKLEDAKLLEERGDRDTANAIYRDIATYSGKVQVDIAKNEDGSDAAAKSAAVTTATPSAPETNSPAVKEATQKWEQQGGEVEKVLRMMANHPEKTEQLKSVLEREKAKHQALEALRKHQIDMAKKRSP